LMRCQLFEGISGSVLFCSVLFKSRNQDITEELSCSLCSWTHDRCSPNMNVQNSWWHICMFTKSRNAMTPSCKDSSPLGPRPDGWSCRSMLKTSGTPYNVYISATNLKSLKIVVPPPQFNACSGGFSSIPCCPNHS
jgi:hypothetical protein